MAGITPTTTTDAQEFSHGTPDQVEVLPLDSPQPRMRMGKSPNVGTVPTFADLPVCVTNSAIEFAQIAVLNKHDEHRRERDQGYHLPLNVSNTPSRASQAQRDDAADTANGEVVKVGATPGPTHSTPPIPEVNRDLDRLAKRREAQLNPTSVLGPNDGRRLTSYQ